MKTSDNKTRNTGSPVFLIIVSLFVLAGVIALVVLFSSREAPRVEGKRPDDNVAVGEVGFKPVAPSALDKLIDELDSSVTRVRQKAFSDINRLHLHDPKLIPGLMEYREMNEAGSDYYEFTLALLDAVEVDFLEQNTEDILKLLNDLRQQGYSFEEPHLKSLLKKMNIEIEESGSGD